MYVQCISYISVSTLYFVMIFGNNDMILTDPFEEGHKLPVVIGSKFPSQPNLYLVSVIFYTISHNGE